ncbi:MAG: hypothetical protein Q4D35_02510 [Ruminococcus sp.]|nr:hypothetical protein [Ruminococcus sp.]
MTLTENINRAIIDFDNIKTAIEDKGVTVGDVPTSDYAEKIGEIQADSDPYEILNQILNKTLEKLRLNHVPTASLSMLKLGNNYDQGHIIKSIELPDNTDNIGVWQFANLKNLQQFDAGFSGKFDNVCLHSCINLKSLIIRNNDVCATLYNTSSITFHSTGKIYVVPELIESYKAATNWTTHANKFRNLYIAKSVEEKNQFLVDENVPSESMIVCDADESYTVKE